MSSNILSDRIVLELKGREPEVVYDITLDNCKVTTLEGFPAELNKLRVMSALNMGLNNLDGLPTLPELSMLDLSDNKMHDFVQLVEKCPNVEHLNLCGNLIKTIDTLKPLQNLSKLATLDLFKNDIVELPSYRADVFALIPHLKYLDGVDKEGRDMEVSDMDDEEEDDLSLGTEDSFSDESAEDVEDEDLETSIGLAYLQTSKALNEEDKSEDYEPNKAQNGSANVENEENEVSTNQDNGKRGIKRKHEADNAESSGPERMSLEIDPSEGVFNVSGERKTFTIINVTKERLAFKVKTSDVDLYRAKPVYGFVVPQEKIKLIIQRMEGPAKLDKIVVQYAEVPEEEVEPKAPFQAEAQSGEVILPVNAKS